MTGRDQLITRLAFGSTGHQSSRVIFGAAAFWKANARGEARALELLLKHGINHIDVAASYGEAEDHVGVWTERHRDQFFLATKTGERSYERAWAALQRPPH